MSSLRHVTRQSFETEVLQSPVPVLVDFYADWCGPCRMLSPILERLATEFAGQVQIVKVNIDHDSELASQYKVSSIPTLLVLHKGRVLGRTTGLASEASLRTVLAQLARFVITPQHVG